MSLQGKRKFWLCFFAALVIVAFIVPFAFLSDVYKVYGAFFFWCIFAVIAITGMELITRRWRGV